MVRSPVWKHFTAVAEKNSAKCDICGHEIKTSTSTIRYHLVQVHKVHLPASEDQSEEPPSKKAKQSPKDGLHFMQLPIAHSFVYR